MSYTTDLKSTPSTILSLPSDERARNIASRKAEVWECIDCFKNENGGHRYTYAFEYTSPQKMKELISGVFPAIEPDPKDLLNFFAKRTYANRSNFRYQLILEQLGFSLDRQDNFFLLTVPDETALQINLERYKNMISHCFFEKESGHEGAGLKIKTGAGVLSDREYASSFSTHDVFLATDDMFFHDMTTHVLSVIETIGRVEGRQRFKASIASALSTMDQIIQLKEEGKLHLPGFSPEEVKQMIPMLEMNLGRAVDVAATHYPAAIDLDSNISTPWCAHDWFEYGKKRFGDEQMMLLIRRGDEFWSEAKAKCQARFSEITGLSKA